MFIGFTILFFILSTEIHGADFSPEDKSAKNTDENQIKFVLNNKDYLEDFITRST